MRMKSSKILLVLIIAIAAMNISKGATKTSTGTGNWNTNGTWSPSGVPANGDDVIILNTHVVTLNNANKQCNKLTVNAGGTLEITSSRKLTLTGTCAINGTCNVNNGLLVQNTNGAGFNMGAGSVFVWNPSTNNSANATIWTNSTENFNETSSITIKRWYSTAVSLGSVVTGHFGNLTLNTGSAGWNQKNGFATHQIKGTLTIDSDYIILDDVNSASATTVPIGNIVLQNSGLLDFFDGTRTGAITVSTSSLTITDGELDMFYLPGTGTLTFNVSGNVTVAKDGILVSANQHDGAVTFNVGGNLINNGGLIYGSLLGDGNSTTAITGNFENNISTFTGEYYGSVNGNGNSSLTVGGNLINHGYLDLIWNTGTSGVGNGNGTLTVTGSFTQSEGDLRAIFNLTTTNAGAVALTFGSINFTGGIFMGNYSCNSTGTTNTMVVNGNANITFSNSTDVFRGIGLSTLTSFQNNAIFSLVVAGSLTITGNGAAEFRSSAGNSAESITVTGNTAFSGGLNYFNYSESHNSTYTFTGDVSVSGGSTFLSYSPGNSTITMSGALNISGGQLSIKDNTGVSSVTIQGSYVQSAGTIYIYGNNSTSSTDNSSLTINGSFDQSGGTINFNANATGPNPNNIYINGDTYSISGSGSITSSNTNVVNFGKLYFSKAGTINYSRSGNHAISNVKQYINSGTTLNTTTGIQISSASASTTDMLTVTTGGTMVLDQNKISSNLINSNSGITVESNGTLKLANINGLYNGTSEAGIDYSGGMDYSLDPSSVIEYNGNNNQIITGIGNGLATGNQHKYGTLKINFTGTPNTEFVSPSDNNIYIRTSLNLENGELNLNDKSITIESGSTSAISRTTGYIKSETNSATNNAIIKWLNMSTGNYIFPFGYDNSNYIPVTINVTAGGPAEMQISTRASANDNTPLTTGVNQINSNGNNVGTTGIIDRWWNISTTTAITADVTLSYRGSENTTISPTADFATQFYNAADWTTQSGTAPGVTTGIGTITATGVSTFGPVLLVGSSYALPVELSYFTVQPLDGKADIRWATSSEKNNDYFNVERSQEGTNWEYIYKVKGAGNAVNTNYYRYTDNNPLPGKSYYRLKQTDFNGKSTYSPVRPFNKNISANQNENAITGIRPNPFKNTFTMQFNMESEGKAQLIITSARGQTVYKSDIEVVQGINYYDYQAESNLPAGYYTLTLIKGTSQLTRKIIKSN